MSARLDTGAARAMAMERDGQLQVVVGGTWQVTAPRPAWSDIVNQRKPTQVALLAVDLEKWDSSVLLFLFEVQEWCRATRIPCEVGALPEKIRALLAQFVTAHETSVPVDRSESFLMSVGRATIETYNRGRTASTFVGER